MEGPPFAAGLRLFRGARIVALPAGFSVHPSCAIVAALPAPLPQAPLTPTNSEVLVPHRGHSCLSNIVVLVIAIVVCVAVLDAVAYFALGIRGSRHGDRDVIQFSPLLGHFHRPLSEGRYYPRRGREGHEVKVNSRGFTDEERDIEKSRPRVLLIGDSTTEAWEVDPPKRPHVVLEELLGGKYEVLNCGVRAYGTDQCLILLERIAMAFDPDIVVYTFCINDIRDNGKDYAKPWFEIDEQDTTRLIERGYPIAKVSAGGDRTSGRLWKYSLVYRTFGLAVSKFGKRFRGAENGGGVFPLEDHYELTPYKTVYDENESARWAITRRLVRRMRESSNASGAEFLVVECLHLPEISEEAAAELTAPYELEAEFDFGKVTCAFQGLVDDTGLAFVSMANEVKREGLDPAELMPPGDTIHLSAEGIRLWARVVEREFRERGWLEQ